MLIRSLLFLIYLTFIIIVPLIKGQQVTLIQTSKDTNDRLTVKESLSFNTSSYGSPSLKIDLSQNFQTIVGFGGALTEASAIVWSSLREDLQEEVLNAYYGSQGIGYSIGRVAINSCDFSTGNYSYDTTPDDFDLNNFELTTHDTDFVIPLVLKAMKYHSSWSDDQFNIFASPWSPPAWMKQNEQMNDSPPIGLKDGESYHKSWALYFSKFITAYADKGVPIWAITAQNEPNVSPRWEACCYTADAQRDFVRDYLGPRLRADHPSLKIMIFDDQKLYLDKWLDIVMSDSDAAKYIDGFAVHWYTGDQFWALNNAHQSYPQNFILPSEACITQPPKIGEWSRGERYGHDIMGDLQNWAVGWTDWNILLDQQGGPNHVENYCDAPLIANISGTLEEQVLYYQIPYFYMGHFSKYIPRGSVRISSTDEDNLLSSLEFIAFITPQNNVVVVVMNRNDESVQFEIEQSGRYLNELSIPGHSIQTYIYPSF